MSLLSLSADATLRVAYKVPVEQRFICKHVSTWLQNVMDHAGSEKVEYMAIFRTVFLLASQGHQPSVIQKWVDKMLHQVDPNGAIGFHDIQLIILCSQSIKRTLSKESFAHWQLDERIHSIFFPFLAVRFNNDHVVQTLNDETVCRISINQGNPHYLKYFDGFSLEDIMNGFTQVLQKRNVSLVHLFMKLYGSHIQKLQARDKRKCWDMALWLDLDTFRIVDSLAEYPTILNERALGEKLQQMSVVIFKYLRQRLSFATLSPIASYFPKTDGTCVYEWLYTKIPKTFAQNDKVVHQLMNEFLDQGNVEALKWTIEKYNLAEMVAKTCDQTHSLSRMLSANMSKQQIHECWFVMYGRTLEQTCLDGSFLSNWAWSSAYHMILEYLPMPNNFWLLEYLHLTKQIRPEGFEELGEVRTSTNCKLTTCSIIHKSPDIFEWLVSTGYSYDWTAMGAAVLSLDLQGIKTIHNRYFTNSDKDVPVMLLASIRGNVDIIHFLHQCGYVADVPSMLLETIQSCSITATHYVFKMYDFTVDLEHSYWVFVRALVGAKSKLGHFPNSFAVWMEKQVLPIFDNTKYHGYLLERLAFFKTNQLSGTISDETLAPIRNALRSVFGGLITKYQKKLYIELHYQNNWLSEIIGPEATQVVVEWLNK